METKAPHGVGHGRSASFTLPLVRNTLDAYGEVGQGIDGYQNETFGVYLPGVFQSTGVNVFGEYARKLGVSQAYSMTALYEVPKGPQLRSSVDWINGSARFSVGAAIKF